MGLVTIVDENNKLSLMSEVKYYMYKIKNIQINEKLYVHASLENVCIAAYDVAKVIELSKSVSYGFHFKYGKVIAMFEQITKMFKKKILHYKTFHVNIDPFEELFMINYIKMYNNFLHNNRADLKRDLKNLKIFGDVVLNNRFLSDLKPLNDKDDKHAQHKKTMAFVYNELVYNDKIDPKNLKAINKNYMTYESMLLLQYTVTKNERAFHGLYEL
ncbi:MAG: hypothetical protein EOM41_08530 [Bacilli bacterium]|nr:hypothetical protein [Bacilli bacterium]